jgi:hypothetical protein
LTSNESGVYFMVTSLGVMRIFPIQIITEEGRVIKGLAAAVPAGVTGQSYKATTGAVAKVGK